ncbi:hypothetical protein A4X09_0g6903 [Tilletia walkeri]|uniref:Uncharacterized protein n=1 Tax=Tilletia walkeri TaxID=117179 RepID=A0A8X7N444_9BASI|nr:hypothetical protein A4X09_0g6903 [Tilletia walkeri]
MASSITSSAPLPPTVPRFDSAVRRMDEDYPDYGLPPSRQVCHAITSSWASIFPRHSKLMLSHCHLPSGAASNWRCTLVHAVRRRARQSFRSQSISYSYTDAYGAILVSTKDVTIATRHPLSGQDQVGAQRTASTSIGLAVHAPPMNVASCSSSSKRRSPASTRNSSPTPNTNSYFNNTDGVRHNAPESHGCNPLTHRGSSSNIRALHYRRSAGVDPESTGCPVRGSLEHIYLAAHSPTPHDLEDDPSFYSRSTKPPRPVRSEPTPIRMRPLKLSSAATAASSWRRSFPALLSSLAQHTPSPTQSVPESGILHRRNGGTSSISASTNIFPRLRLLYPRTPSGSPSKSSPVSFDTLPARKACTKRSFKLPLASLRTRCSLDHPIRMSSDLSSSNRHNTKTLKSPGNK